MTDPHRWQVSGSAAEKYERFVASWFVPWAVDLVERSGVQPGWTVLDMACGTGVVTRAAGPILGHAGAIVACDLNEGMLDEARRHEVGGAPVEWRQADALDLPFEAGSFDAVLCQQGLQFIPDRPAAVTEMRRVLRPGSVAAVSAWRSAEHNPYISAVANGLSRHLSPAAGTTMLATTALGEAQELFDLFTGAGFSSVEVHSVTIDRDPVDVVEAVTGNLASLPISDEIKGMDPVVQARMVADIVGGLADYTTDGKLTAPNRSNIAIAIA